MAYDPWVKQATTQVRFVIHPDGSIDTPIVLMGSGRLNYDRRAVESLTKAAPFAPLPVAASPMTFCITYSYNEPYKEHPPADPFAPKKAAKE